MDYGEQSAQEAEPDSGSGKLLGIFFGLVILCAIFFGLGYTFGKNAAPIPNPTLSSEPQSTGNSAVAKPSAVPTLSTDSDPSSQTDPERRAAAQTSPASPKPKPTMLASNARPAPEMARARENIVVQVAAVSKEEDADALVNALHKKSYPVFVQGNAPGDKLFHVQIGPFSELKDAEVMRSRLAGDGYNAIVKK